MNTSMLKRTNLLKVTLVTAAAMLAACLQAVVGMEKPAGATFPGENGKIAYMTDRFTGAAQEIEVVNADGSNQTRLTTNATNDFGPSWSSDGTKIAFYTNRDGNNEIYVMNADGSNQTRLTNNAAHEQDPTWSPDGTKIAFVTTRDGQFKVYSMNADGSNQTRLTNTGGNESDPSWQPLLDRTPPTFILPADITKEATDATGATVNYTATATDDRDGIVPVNCSPPSESTFPIGTTAVQCTATDSSGNTASGSFTVTVKGATDQISDIEVLVTSLALPAGIDTSLQVKLNDALSAANGGDTASACTALNDFISQVRAQQGKKKISTQDAEELIAEAQRIQAVLGCS